MSAAFDQTGYVQRIDVALRARFPNLTTRIFETAPGRFAIQFDAAQQDASMIAEEFNERIRYATVNVEVTNSVPQVFVRELPGISDWDVARGPIGLPFTRFDLYSLLNARFPNVHVLDVRNDGRMVAIVPGTVSHGERAELLKFLNGLEMPGEWVVETGAGPVQPPKYPYEHSLHILPTQLTNLGSFAAADERRFFEVVEEAPTGQLRREDLIGGGPDVARGLLDLTTGRHVNLRQALLLYDEVWCVPPLQEGMRRFLQDQRLAVEDLLFLAESGRLRFAVTYDERSSDLRLLEAAAERKPSSVLGRRMAGALLLADAARIARDYRLADPALFPACRQLCEVLGPELDLPADELLRAILWPLVALRESVQRVFERGSKGGPAMLMAERLARRVHAIIGVDVGLESYVAAEVAHLAHALGATMIPALDGVGAVAPLARAVGQDLNFYASFNTRIAPAWIGNRDRRERGEVLVEPLPIFEFDRDVPIDEFLADTELASTRRQGRALMSRIADLPAALRNDEIRQLKTALRAKSRRESTRLLSFDNADTLTALASVVFGFLYPPVAGVANAGRRVADLARRVPAVDRMLDTLAADTVALKRGNEDLDFLSRIDRVATLRTHV